MKRLLIGFLILFNLYATAQVKIVDLPASGTITGAEFLPMHQSGATKKVSVDALRGYTGTDKSNWDNTFNWVTLNGANAVTAFGWGDHSGLYRPIGYVPSWSEITSKPTTIAGYGITDFNSLGDARWPLLSGSYANPAWITSLPWSKITSTPTTIAGYGITDFNSLGDARYWKLTGNAGTVDGIDFIGTTDNIPFNIKVNNQKAGRIETGTSANTIFGYQAANSTSNDKTLTAFGYRALYINTTGANNTAFGFVALTSNISGGSNTAVGVASLQASTAASNTAVGANSLQATTSGGSNTGVGRNALITNTTGTNNTAIGFGANVSVNNLTNATAIGYGALVTASNSIQLGDANVTSVNIGTGSTAKIVAGGLQITGGSIATGSVLTSDISGNALWATPTAATLTTARTIGIATGDVTSAGSSFNGSANNTNAYTIANSAVTLAKMADMASSSLIYRKTAGTGAPEVNTLATLKTDLGLTGTNSGDQTSIVGITGTKAQFNTAATDGDFVFVGDNIDATVNKISYGNRTQTGTSYTIQTSDQNYTVHLTGTNPAILLPDGMPVDFSVVLWNKGAGTITVTASTTLESSVGSTVTIPNNETGASFTHVGSNVWEAAGAIGSGGAGGDMLASVYDPANVAEQLVGLTASQAITGKSINGVTLTTAGSATNFLNETGTYTAPIAAASLSSLTAATTTNTINNGGNAQTWNWNTITSNGLVINGTGTTSGSNSRLINLTRSGNHASSSIPTYVASFSNNHTGTGAVNYGIYASATGGATNYALVTYGKALLQEETTSLSSTAFPIQVYATATGTPTTGFGNGIEFITETDASNNLERGATIETVSTDLTATSEDFDVVTKTMTNGATATEKHRIKSTGQIQMANYTTSTSFTGTPVGTLQFDASGNVLTAPVAGYSINVQALTSSPADGATTYFGMLPKAPTTTANISKIYIRKTGTIKAAEIYCYSGTAGTSEAWSLYIRLNNTTDYLIGTLSVSTNERVFTNTGLNIAVTAGDYIEVKSINPTWATNPLTTIFGGYISIE
jgi:hypothetical protein